MPFHRFYCPPGLYTKEEKHAIAQAIVKYYANLPPFLVIVTFIEVEKDNYYVGGESTDRFVRINVQHSAHNAQDAEEKRAWMDGYEKAIEPYTKGKGISWELLISNEDREYWNANGVQPPPFLSEPYREWMKLNKVVEWREGSNGGSSAEA